MWGEWHYTVHTCRGWCWTRGAGGAGDVLSMLAGVGVGLGDSGHPYWSGTGCSMSQDEDYIKKREGIKFGLTMTHCMITTN